ncbi:hypothetical protein NFJ02_27g62420 [Pycnococcus provasolii]
MMSDIVATFLSYPTIFKVATVMWCVHGFVLDIVVIGVLPFLSVKASDAERLDKFPWALGGYKNYPRVPNLAPTHRRFIAENAAYAVMRLAPVVFPSNPAVLLTAVLSYFVEGVTIAWEIAFHHAPANSMLPQTLMGVFATVVTYAATSNPGGFVKGLTPTVLQAMQATCGLTWACWVVGAGATATKSGGKKE